IPPHESAYSFPWHLFVHEPGSKPPQLRVSEMHSESMPPLEHETTACATRQPLAPASSRYDGCMHIAPLMAPALDPPQPAPTSASSTNASRFMPASSSAARPGTRASRGSSSDDRGTTRARRDRSLAGGGCAPPPGTRAD